MTLDIAIVSVFLALNLTLGLWYGRKVKTLRQYAIGDKTFSTGTITATIVATGIGGGFVFYGLENTYTKGILFIIPFILIFFSYWLTGRLLVVRMGEFLNNLSVAEAMGDLYGRNVRMLTALSGICKVAGSIAIQFKVIPQILFLVFGLQGSWVTLLTSGIIIVYSAFGGIRSVTLTDVLQFIAVCICLPMLLLAIHQRGQAVALSRLTAHPMFNWQHVLGLMGWNPQCMAFLSLCFLFTFPGHGLDPAQFQRVAMTNSIYQAKSAFSYAAFFAVLITGSVLFLGVLLVMHNPTLQPKELVPYILTTYAAYPAFKGLLAIAVIALSMSTADSFLNAASVLLVNDLVKPLKRSPKPLKHELAIVRICSFVVGSGALLVALQFNDLLQLLLLTKSFSAIYYIPFLASIFGFRSTPRVVLQGMAAGGITIGLWRTYCSATGIDSTLPGMLANGVVLFISHALLPKKRKTVGWVGIQDPDPLLEARWQRRQMWNQWVAQIRGFRLYAYCQRLVPKQEMTYSVFALYALFTLYIPLLKMGELGGKQFSILATVLFFSSIFPITVFMTYPAWPAALRWKPFIVFFWPIGVGYILFGASTAMLIVSEFQSIQLVIAMTHLLFASLLMPWPVMLLLMGVGLAVAWSLLNGLVACVWLLYTSRSILAFTSIYSVLLFLILLRMLYKHQHEKQLLAQAQKYQKSLVVANEKDRLHNLQYQALHKETVMEQKEPLQYVKKALQVCLDKYPEEKEVAEKGLEQLDAFITYQRNSFYHSMDYLRLTVAPITVEALWAQLARALTACDLQACVHFRCKTQQTTIVCDCEKVVHLLVTSLQKQWKSYPLFLSAYDTTLQYLLQAVPDPDYVRVLPAIGWVLHTDPPTPLEACYPGNTGDVTMQVPRSVADLPQRKNARILDAHYGYSHLPENQQWLYVLPVNLRAIRPPVVDQMPWTGEGVLENAVSLAAEADFLDQVKLHTAVDLAILKEVIGHIKYIHQGQFRKSGDLFYTHPLTVATLVLRMTQDPDVLVAALLHDSVEDTPLSLDLVRYRYGHVCAFIVGRVTHLDPTKKKTQLTEAENQCQLAAAQDARVVMVKLADRLHNVRTMGVYSLEKQDRIAQETLDFYVPLGRKLGMPAVDRVVDEIVAQCQALLPMA